MAGQNLTRAEARERARLVRVGRYRIALDLGNAKDAGAGTFRSASTIEFDCAEPGAATFLDLIAPAVESVELNGRMLDPAEVFRDSRITLDGLAAHNVVTVVAQCAYSRTGEGLHRFVDPVDQQTYLYTQFEPADARRLYADFEQPDLKASFVFDITAPAGWHMSSNAAPARRAKVVDGVARWTFSPTERISTYITVVVAGPYHVAQDEYTRVLSDGSTLYIPLSALCRKSLTEYFDDTEIFDVTKRGLDFYHDHFDYPYPFGKYDQAFVPEYNLGAMENPGCVTFTEDYIFRSKVTDAAYEGRANTILHEMAHMWFGDLVTMQWWDDLWLKESLAEFFGSYVSVKATRWTNAWVTFANRRKAWAYRQDQLPTTHPIVATIDDLEDAKLNFDGITYSKGAAVIKQLVAYVGEENFLEGLRRYFKRHAFGNTTLADLLAALEETSGRDLGAWSKAWLETSGVNTLSHGRDGLVRQAGHPRPHLIALAAYRADEYGRPVRVAEQRIDLGAEPVSVHVRDGDFLLINDTDQSYCKLLLSPADLAWLRERLSSFEDPMARSLLWSSLWNMTRDGVLPATEFIDLVDRHGPAESMVGVVQNLQREVRIALDYYLPDDLSGRAGRQVAAMALRELRAAQPGSDHQLAWAGFLAGAAVGDEEFGLLADLLAGRAGLPGLEVDTELRWTFLKALVGAGRAGEAELDAELARDGSAAGRLHHTAGLAARPLPEAKARAWRLAVDAGDLPTDLLAELLGGMSRADQRELLPPFVEPYFARLDAVWAERTIENATRVASLGFPHLLVDRGTLDRADHWLAGEHAPALRRLVLEQRDDLARALTARALLA
ncbi:MAG TPA: aminopeptidase N [Actinocrinis sp.]|nr:aminopeptidase N [Actinocrinis sp.]